MSVRLNRALGLLAAVMLAGCPHDLTRNRPGDGGYYETGAGDLGDGGPADLPPCFPTDSGIEVCDGRDNDCDGLVDEDFNLQTDPFNCGACGRACLTPNATPGCEAGQCVVRDCARDGNKDATHWDNDGKWENGCEHSCSITSGGHEVCDKTDNDCDEQVDEQCDELSLLYRFGDTGTQQKWPKVFNLVPGPDAEGNSGSNSSPATVGVAGADSDGLAVSLDGTSGMLEVDETEQVSVSACEAAKNWYDSAGSPVTLEKAVFHEGSGALRFSAKSNTKGVLAHFNDTVSPWNLIKWRIPSSNKLRGYLTFWLYVEDPAHSRLGEVTLGQGNTNLYAQWGDAELHVVGPTPKKFSKRWNLVALPLETAFYKGKANIKWNNVQYLVLYSNVLSNKADHNFFLIDDIRVEADLSQRFTRFTVMAWVKPTVVKAGTSVINKEAGLPGLGTDGQKRWLFTLGENTKISGSAAAKAGAWTHLAMTFDGSLMTAYQDGVELGSDAGEFVPGGMLRFGAADKKTGHFEGLLDEVALHTRALEAAEIKRYYDLFRP